MEIERKFLIDELPEGYGNWPSRMIEQGYLCTEPVVRIRREDDSYYLTYKSGGLMAREEYNLPLTQEAYAHLKPKIDGNLITKRRFLIPWEKWTVEMDVFEGCFAGLVLAEVEFSSMAEAKAFVPAFWFGEEVTWSAKYQNSTLSRMDMGRL